MADNTPDVIPSEDASSRKSRAEAMQDLGARLNDHPRLKKLIVVQTIILIVLAMVFVGGLAIKTTQYLAEDSDAGSVAGSLSSRTGTNQSLPIPSGGAIVANGLRPDGATLIAVSDGGGGLLLLHFRREGADIVIRYNPETGVHQRIEIP